MISDAQIRLVKLRNELKAQKTAMELAYSSILWPQNTPEATWSGTVNLQLQGDVVARFRARFTRTDGKEGAPYVDFAQNVTFSPSYPAYCASIGWNVSGNDINYVDDQNYTGYVAGTGTNYVDYYIDLVRDLMSNYNAISTIDVNIEGYIMEKELQKLEDEIRAQKAVYEKMATQMPVFTKSVDFATQANPMTIDYGGGTTYSFDGNERVQVTFITSRGSNTIAALEILSDGVKADLKVKRAPYSGGARWIVYDMPNYNNGNRIDTHYTFTVQSAVDGNLEAKMIWE